MTGPRTPRPVGRRTIIKALGGSLVAAPLLGAAGCGAGEPDAGSLRISYQQFGSDRITEAYLTPVIQEYSARHPDISIELVPLVAAENDYFTKNELMMSSERTAPDLVFEDTFILKSDIAAGYLRPIDDRVEAWPIWNEYYDVARNAVRGADGRVYAVPAPTDARAMWHNQDILKEAGIGLPWAPRTWDDILVTCRTIQQRLPDVIPINIYSGKAQGEKASMQGLEMLLYGTESTLYDEPSKKWITGSAGFTDSLRFLQAVFAEELGPAIGDSLDPNLNERIYSSWLPQGELAILLDGNWISSNWIEGGPGEWPAWEDVMRVAAMPTQHGQAPGFVSMAGGWSWALPQKATNPEQAWNFLEEMMSTDNVTRWTVADSKLANRRDVAARPEYKGYSSTSEFFSGLVPDATYRPALAPYPEVSSAIQAAMETIMIGQAPPEDAATAYDRALTEIVGPENTAEES